MIESCSFNDPFEGVSNAAPQVTLAQSSRARQHCGQSLELPLASHRNRHLMHPVTGPPSLRTALPHAAGPTLPRLLTLLALLLRVLGHELCVLGGLVLLLLVSSAFERHQMSLMLETLGCDEALDAWSFGVRFGAFFLGDDFAADDEFAYLRRTRSA